MCLDPVILSDNGPDVTWQFLKIPLSAASWRILVMTNESEPGLFEGVFFMNLPNITNVVKQIIAVLSLAISDFEAYVMTSDSRHLNKPDTIGHHNHSAFLAPCHAHTITLPERSAEGFWY